MLINPLMCLWVCQSDRLGRQAKCRCFMPACVCVWVVEGRGYVMCLWVCQSDRLGRQAKCRCLCQRVSVSGWWRGGGIRYVSVGVPV